jgi:hypothetical protein
VRRVRARPFSVGFASVYSAVHGAYRRINEPGFDRAWGGGFYIDIQRNAEWRTLTFTAGDISGALGKVDVYGELSVGPVSGMPGTCVQRLRVCCDYAPNILLEIIWTAVTAAIRRIFADGGALVQAALSEAAYPSR